MTTKQLEKAVMPDKDYSLATVVDSPSRIQLEDLLKFLYECKPAAVIVFRMAAVITWICLLASLILGRF